MIRLLQRFAHPGARTLTRVVLGEGRVRARVRRHLAACTRCQGEMRALRSLVEQTATLPVLEPSSDLFDRIRARVQSGDDVILPLPPAPSDRAGTAADRGVTWRRNAVIAAIVMLAAGLVWIGRPSPELVAGDVWGELRLVADPARPRLLTVSYRAPGIVARHRALVLRARYRTVWDAAYAHGTRQLAADTLMKGREGIYHGRVTIPDSVVFAVFAVEDPAATHVDDNRRALWEWMATRPDGQPTSEALKQREHDMMGRNVELAFTSARLRARLYPDDPGAWGGLAFHESINLGRDADTLQDRHEQRLTRFHQHWVGRNDAPIGIASGLLSYAAQLGDSAEIRRAVRAHWLPIWKRLVATDTLSDVAGIDARWWSLNHRAFAAPESARVALRSAETLWAEGGSRYPWGARLGAQIAWQARDSGDARLRWADRVAAAFHEVAEYAYAGDLLTTAPLRPVAIARLQALVDGLARADDSRRPLEMTRREAAAADSARARDILASLADGLLAEGDTSAARAALERATASGWNTRLFRRAADLGLRLGDTARAAAHFARVTADPATPGTTADSLSALGRRFVGSARWNELQGDGQRLLRERSLAHAVRERLSEPITFVDVGSTRTTLREIAQGRVTVVAFWARWCAPSRQQMPLLDSLATQLARLGAVLVPITRESPSPAVTAYLAEQRVRTKVYHDVGGSAVRGFNNFATPEYHVIDGNGVLRFRRARIEDVLAQVAALSTAP